MDLQQEHELTCPACGETITVLVDASLPRQSYVEDCEVCCRPLVLEVWVEAGAVTRLEARREDE